MLSQLCASFGSSSFCRASVEIGRISHQQFATAGAVQARFSRERLEAAAACRLGDLLDHGFHGHTGHQLHVLAGRFQIIFDQSR